MMEEAIKNLYNAVAKGDINTLQQLLQQEPQLLGVATFPCSRNILHIAVMKGQAPIVAELLERDPCLARDSDSQKQSPLHIAAAVGHVDIASRLMSVAPEMCWSRDGQGMNPVHVAAMNGHAEVLEILDLRAAKERVDGGMTALHLCVKHQQLRALKVLVEKGEELAMVRDNEGDTVLHMAIKYKNVSMIQYLAESDKIDMGSRNSKGKTAIQIFWKIFPDATSLPLPVREAGEALMRRTATINIRMKFIKLQEQFINQRSKVAMVVAVLIATMAYQSSAAPPGGVWQEDSPAHRAGEAVLASSRPKLYTYLVVANTTAFVSSLVVIFVHSFGLPTADIFLMNVVSLAMWMSLSATAVSYGAAVFAVTPGIEMRYFIYVIIVIVVAICCLTVFLTVPLYLWLWRFITTRNSASRGRRSV